MLCLRIVLWGSVGMRTDSELETEGETERRVMRWEESGDEKE